MTVIIYDSNDKELDRVKDVISVTKRSDSTVIVVSEYCVRVIDTEMRYLKCQ